MLRGRVLLTGAECAVRFIMELVSCILRGCAYDTVSGMCSPSGVPLGVCAFMSAYTAVGSCSLRQSTVAVRAMYPSS